MTIHPTAIIHPNAKIASDVQIGAYSLIGEHVTIESGTIVASHVTIQGVTTIGKNNRFYSYGSIGSDPQDKKYKGEPTELLIGENNTFRECVTISTGTIQDEGITRIGNHNLFMATIHIAHDCQIGSHTVFANGTAIAGHVKIGDWTILSGLNTVHQFVTIGAHVLVSLNTGVTQDIPPYVVAQGYRAEPYGINSEGLKRRGFSRDAINEIKRAYKLIYRRDLPLEEARAEIAKRSETIPELKLFNQFFGQSKRGLIR